MGAACCVAATDKTIVNGSGSEVIRRNIRYSPRCSSRWNNQGHVVGEDTSISWFSDTISRNDGSEIKSESACTLEDRSPSKSFQSCTLQKFPTSEGAAGQLRTPASDQSVSRSLSIDVNLEQANELVESPAVSYLSPFELSLPLPSASLSVTSPSSSRSHAHPTSSTNRCSVGGERLVMPSWSNESTRGSWGGSSNGLSTHTYSAVMATSQSGRWSFDDDKWGFLNENISKSSGRLSASSSIDLQVCGVCSKSLSEKSLWSSQKIIMSNELSVVAVLTCGHVYHAECLENTTPEIDKYNPSCPICTLGEKKHKSFKAETDFKAKINKRSRSRVVDSDMDSDPLVFNHLKSSGNEKRASSSSMKNSIGRPFLRKHFSSGPKGIKSLSENHSTGKKGIFHAKSSKT
ncbi:hypothetical protein ERO13_D12G029800v2 [Gossypium hirsutum]|uniref:RING-type domain-containing protein n=1 Tax=Gossypium hirsutum TaxID=3635 RepID=A0A1U8N5R8_GOSHI|nr:uncharacterized protein LOC107945022 [Gossypium hirsutum]XP_016734320.2 uncharacterized protein LOC107945022 [Gossypium hirsutum]XP_016734321.2 uncharacterized protein LOC107945022 [Gossypium hirsutum]XP_040964193.1 uncharacterized protein LOC107945022 [Gossypium hirsutum]KAG4114168.1 hypothetical protein ERO13_D12G029800v2 [Gossypium hirsutum]KAG4114169.1 hypothetical protein ERO13_D12G029800v2 [Gossypium hirsutum]KAG4114170.1 hypothetical protein ERO13_D12G029800v2 [Gossypium hirsutum]K